jgi:U3 small nucleolar RNA-associated protein 10
VTAFFDLVFRTLHGADRSSVLEQLRPLFKMFIEALSLALPGHDVEASIISAFRELVVKLNETAFRPLFRRLYDWAFAAEKGAWAFPLASGPSVNFALDEATRKVVFIHLYLGLQEYFKGLMSPYMSFLLQPYEEILKSFSASGERDQRLWNATVRSLLNSLNHDDSGAFLCA